MRDQPRARGIRPFLTAAATLAAASAWVSLSASPAREAGRADLRISSNLLQFASAVEREG